VSDVAFFASYSENFNPNSVRSAPRIHEGNRWERMAETAQRS